LLRELIGGGELRELLDLEVLAEVEAELQQLTDDRKARSVDEVHDLLRRVGDLSIDEIAARTIDWGRTPSPPAKPAGPLPPDSLRSSIDWGRTPSPPAKPAGPLPPDSLRSSIDWGRTPSPPAKPAGPLPPDSLRSSIDWGRTPSPPAKPAGPLPPDSLRSSIDWGRTPSPPAKPAGPLPPDSLRSSMAGPELGELGAAIDALIASRRIAQVRIAGVARLIAAEDAARYRDGLGVQLPAGLPAALLEPITRAAGGAGSRSNVERDAFVSLVARWARTHAPFTAAEPAARWGLPAAQVEPVLGLLEASGQLVRGELRPGGTHKDSCDPEVLRQLRRRTLAKLRAQVAPVGAAAFAAFLPRWHGLDQPRRGVGALRDAIGRLEGVALPFSELE